MPIPLTCPCGRNFRLKDHLAGRKVRCPDCSSILAVPDMPVAEYAEQELPQAQEETPSEGSYTPYRSREDDPSYAPRPSSRPKRPKRRTRERSESSGVTFEEGWFGSLNAGVIGGLLMILIAVAWFVGGLMVGFIFFYPPVLLVVGIIALARGLVTRS